jgi:hypothetical protein
MTILYIIDHRAFYVKTLHFGHGFSLHLQVIPTQMGSVERASLYLVLVTGERDRYVCWDNMNKFQGTQPSKCRALIKGRIIDNVQNCDYDYYNKRNESDVQHENQRERLIGSQTKETLSTEFHKRIRWLELD